MAAGFGALRDDDVGAVFLEPDRLLHDGGAAITMQPAALTRLSSAWSGRPKWKLTTSGFNSSTSSHIAASNGARLAALTGAAGSSPNSL